MKDYKYACHVPPFISKTVPSKILPASQKIQISEQSKIFINFRNIFPIIMHFLSSIVYISAASLTLALVPDPLEVRSIGSSCTTPVRPPLVFYVSFTYPSTGWKRNLPEDVQLYFTGLQSQVVLSQRSG